MKHTVPALLALLLAGCVNFGERSNLPAVTHYVLEDAAADVPVRAAPADARVLLVLDTGSSGFYDALPIAFSREAGTRGQYQFARWTERPGKRFADLLRARLERQGNWRIASGSVHGDLVLDTELVELYHDATQTPGTLHFRLRAELIDPKRHSLVDHRTFGQRVPLASFDAAGAAHAANRAVAGVLDELAGWLALPR